ncbi:unnamed protein product [Choristocarpus tenellus]
MAATKVDEVARQAMWAETIKKENAMISKPHKFFLNPNKLVFISRKPTEVDPRTYEKDSLLTPEKVSRLLDVGKESLLDTSPADSSRESARMDTVLWTTQAQQWGSFYGREDVADPFTSQRSCWRKPRSRCDVTEYADRYCEMTRVSPYARKGADAGTKP